MPLSRAVPRPAATPLRGGPSRYRSGRRVFFIVIAAPTTGEGRGFSGAEPAHEAPAGRFCLLLKEIDVVHYAFRRNRLVKIARPNPHRLSIYPRPPVELDNRGAELRLVDEAALAALRRNGHA